MDKITLPQPLYTANVSDEILYMYTLAKVIQNIEKPTIISSSILYDILKQTISSKEHFNNIVSKITNTYNGIIVDTSVTTYEKESLWYILPYNYINARKVSVYVPIKYRSYISKLVGKEGRNAERIIDTVNTIKEYRNEYAETLESVLTLSEKLIFKQRDNNA